MTDLIACLSTGKGTISHVSKVIEGMEWGNVFLITNELAEDTLETKKDVERIVIDTKKTMTEMAAEIKSKLDGKINDLEIALNIVSGEGREHMALVSALLSLGLGFRLVALTKGGVKVL